mgnify:CR=1 FL=1
MKSQRGKRRARDPNTARDMGLETLADVLDGAVAKASGTSNPRGAFLDSVSDRLTDSASCLVSDEGDISGTVHLKNSNLTIGKEGKVRADVYARSMEPSRSTTRYGLFGMNAKLAVFR